LAELTVTLLLLEPALVPVTLTASVQLPLAASVTELRLTVPVPCVAVTEPPQVLLKPFGVATTTPEGSVSMKFKLVWATLAEGLVMVNVSEVLVFSGMEAAPKTLVIVGG